MSYAWNGSSCAAYSPAMACLTPPIRSQSVGGASMAKVPSVCIVVLTRNGLADTQACLESLRSLLHVSGRNLIRPRQRQHRIAHRPLRQRLIVIVQRRDQHLLDQLQQQGKDEGQARRPY